MNSPMTCTMCKGPIGDLNLYDDLGIREILITGLCVACQFQAFDPVELGVPCCEEHELPDSHCENVALAELDVREYDSSEKEQELMFAEGLPREYFSTDRRWIFEMWADAAAEGRQFQR
jgi:hypothetical protein